MFTEMKPQDTKETKQTEETVETVETEKSGLSKPNLRLTVNGFFAFH